MSCPERLCNRANSASVRNRLREGRMRLLFGSRRRLFEWILDVLVRAHPANDIFHGEVPANEGSVDDL